MSTAAIVMMAVAMAVIWGGLALAIASLVRHGAVEDRPEAASRELRRGRRDPDPRRR